MSTPAADFAQELELFRTESESALQFFFAWAGTHAVAAANPKVARLLNQAPIFWNTSLGALQSSTLVALGRVFDPDPKNHSVTRLLTIGHANLPIFSKDALAERKRKMSANADEWLPDYLTAVYEPKGEDFRRLKAHVSVRRKVYEETYKPLRHKLYAHRGVLSHEEVSYLYAKTDKRELQLLLVFLRRLHEALWQLYYNGYKPVLRPGRYSVRRMLDNPSPTATRSTLQERLVTELQTFLQRHSSDA